MEKYFKEQLDKHKELGIEKDDPKMWYFIQEDEDEEGRISIRLENLEKSKIKQFISSLTFERQEGIFPLFKK